MKLICAYFLVVGGLIGSASLAATVYAAPSEPIMGNVTVAKPVPAFPGAEGFGANAVGGRGGEVYHVTNLDDAGPGSFRDAVSKPNRIVVFDVGGLINIKARVSVAANLTIAGQTAPGEGVTVYGNGVSYSNANNTITRYIRYRMGKSGDSGKDALTIAEGHDMIFDHVSVSWGRDETFSVSGPVSNVTIQNCIIAQGLQTHSAGGLIQTDGGVSILRTLYIDNHTRNPKVKGKNQFVNNVVYNWEVGAYIEADSAGRSDVSVADNYFINGPGTGSNAFTRPNQNFHINAAGNFQDSDRDGKLNGQLLGREAYGNVTWMEKSYDYPAIKPRAAEEAFTYVNANAGASLHRDRVDKILVEELNSFGKLGKTISDENAPPMNGPGPIAGGTAPVDTDRDGMPDEWEKAHGLDPAKADDSGDKDANGYTNIEDYLNSLVPVAN